MTKPIPLMPTTKPPKTNVTCITTSTSENHDHCHHKGHQITNHHDKKITNTTITATDRTSTSIYFFLLLLLLLLILLP